MISWCPSSFVLLFTIPVVLSRYVEHINPRRATLRYAENRDEDDNVPLFPKSHLRLHNRPPRVLHTKEGSNEVLECQAGGSPIPRIYWLKDGTLISQIDLSDELELQTVSNANRRLNIGSTSAKLYLDCMSVGDEAEYSCVAEAANHRESTSTRITVASAAERGCHDKKQFGQAPRILSWTKTALEEQGQDIKVICRVDGLPQPTIKWLDPREREIMAGDSIKYQITSNGDLLIRNLKWSDMGNYVCMAENEHGTAKAEVFVYPSTPEP